MSMSVGLLCDLVASAVTCALSAAEILVDVSGEVVILCGNGLLFGGKMSTSYIVPSPFLCMKARPSGLTKVMPPPPNTA